MVGFFKKLAGFLLLLIGCCYVLIFIVGNGDTILAFAEKLKISMTASSGSLFQRSPIESSLLSSGNGQEGGDQLFPYPHLLEEISSQSSQAVLILGEGSKGNLFRLVKQGNEWYVNGGPYYCRLGKEGLAVSLEEGANKTPLGLSYLGSAYGRILNRSFDWPFVKLKPGAVWVTDPASASFNTAANLNDSGLDYSTHLVLDSSGDTIYLDMGYNFEKDITKHSGILIYSAKDLGNGTRGGVALSNRDLRSLLEWLSIFKKPAVAVFNAAELAYQIEEGMPEDFVFLTDVAKNIKEDSRYASSNNFMGRPLDGYYGNRIVVNKYLAEALKELSDNLKYKDLGLLVYDGYRPKRAVEGIFRWMEDETDNGMKEQYYPNLSKPELAGIYLAEQSPHTKGIAVDLTLYRISTGEALDMGTPFDFFSPLSGYWTKALTQEQEDNRKLLRELMISEGFTPYNQEWWHFNYYEIATDVTYDFIIPK